MPCPRGRTRALLARGGQVRWVLVPRGALLSAVLASIMAIPGGASAQAVPASPAALRTPASAMRTLTAEPTSWTAHPISQPSTGRSPWWAPLASGILPGAGQAMLGQQRGAAYLVADAYLVAQAIVAQRAGDRDRREYRDIAANVARKAFAPAPPVGPWEYYELLETSLESGVFSKSSMALEPETDVGTYNGATWQRARETYWQDPDVAPAIDSPEYQRAIAFYRDRAVTDDFRWSWRNAGFQQGEYRRAVADANRNYQRAVTMVGLVGANHLASLIDAYITVRIRRFGGAGIEVAGMRLDGIETRVGSVGDPAARQHTLRTGVRLLTGR